MYGSYRADVSPYGVFDMAGNVREWCDDRSDQQAAGRPAQGGPSAPRSDTPRVVRGGSWDRPADLARVAGRSSETPGHRDAGLGFRPVKRP